MLYLLFPLCVSSLKIVTSPWAPLVNCTIGSSNFSQASGYYVDLISKIMLNFPSEYKDFDFECMEFDKMISSINNNEADLAMGCISISEIGLQNAKFSTPTYDSGLVLVTMKNKLSLFWVIFQPFDYSMWVFIIILIVMNSHLVWMAEQHEDGPVHINYVIGIIECLQHSLLSLFLIGDLKLRTVVGRTIQIAYWCLGVVIIVSYLSTITATLSINWLSSNIESYEDIKDKKIGTFSYYLKSLEVYSKYPVSYDWSYSEAEKMLDDLRDGVIDAAAMPYPIAVFFAKSDCDYLIVGQRFIIDYFSFVFSENIDDFILRKVTQLNIELYQINYHRKLENKFVLVSSTGACNYSASIPLTVEAIGGMWAALLCSSVFGLAGAIFYKKKLQNLEIDVVNSLKEKKKKNLLQAAEVDLVTKFEKRLRNSEQKFTQKIEDLREALGKNLELATLLKQSIYQSAGIGF